MARRRRTETNSSLELLLDTMTNAFGGVLFLAILISIQLKDRAEVSAEQPDLQSEITRLESEKAVLEMQIESQVSKKELADKFLEHYGDASDLLALEHLQTLKESLRELMLEDAGAAKEIAKIQEAEDKSAREIEALAKKSDAMRDELLRMRAELETEKDRRTISGKLPRRKRSSKSEVALAMKFGRLYQVVQNGKYNTTDFVVNESLAGASLLPKQDRGDAIADAKSVRRLVLDNVNANPSTHYVAIAVWQDSFEHFQKIKKHVVAAGFEYRLIMMKANEPLGTGSGASYTQ